MARTDPPLIFHSNKSALREAVSQKHSCNIWASGDFTIFSNVVKILRAERKTGPATKMLSPGLNIGSRKHANAAMVLLLAPRAATNIEKFLLNIAFNIIS